MIREALISLYQKYIDCINSQAWDRLGEFVDHDVRYNEKLIYLSGYRKMLENDFLAIPDLKFTIDIVCSDPPIIASRLNFDCTPTGALFGLPVNGKRVQFSEHVFYEFHEGKILRVNSIIDQSEIARQIAL